MKNNHAAICYFAFLLSQLYGYPTFGQKEAKFYEKGEEYLRNQYYDEAKQQYAKASIINSVFKDLPYKLALTTLLTGSGDREPISSFTSYEDPYAEQDEHYYYWLGQIYLRRYMVEEAIASFERFHQKNQHSDKDKNTQRLVAHSQIVHSFISHPGNYEIHQLRSPINSESTELSPVFFEEKGELLFSSNRGKSGEKPFSIYYSKKKDNGWNTPTEVSNLGTFTQSNANIEVINENERLFLFREDNGGNLFFSRPTSSTWTTPVPFDSRLSNNNIASHFFINTHADRILFSSNREEKGLDLYESFKDPKNGKWSLPAPFYSSINSAHNEDSPYLSPDEQTLYFSSDKPEGIGGYDVYVSHFDQDTYTWSEPKNMGWPINSPNDELHFKMNKNQSSGYFVSNRLYTRGNYDIYFFWHIEKVAVEGRIFNTSIDGPLTNAKIRFHPTQYLDEYFQSIIDSTGHYKASIIANEVFNVEIIKNGKILLKETFEIQNVAEKPTTHFKNFTVKY